MPDDIYYDEPTAEEAYAMSNDVPPDDIMQEQEAPAEEPLSFERRIIDVQRRLKAPKNSWNAFGKYSYRNCEDILEGLKPLLKENDLLMTMDDDVFFLEGRFYIRATVTVRDVLSDKSHSVSAYAREPENKKGVDQSQVTGSCSSYARKYALSALWLIDDNKDPDMPQGQQEQKPKQPPAQGPFVARCANCGTQYQFQNANQYQQFIANPGCCNNPQWMVL